PSGLRVFPIPLHNVWASGHEFSRLPERHFCSLGINDTQSDSRYSLTDRVHFLRIALGFQVRQPGRSLGSPIHDVNLGMRRQYLAQSFLNGSAHMPPRLAAVAERRQLVMVLG